MAKPKQQKNYIFTSAVIFVFCFVCLQNGNKFFVTVFLNREHIDAPLTNFNWFIRSPYPAREKERERERERKREREKERERERERGKEKKESVRER
jgi:hypothetical protein